MLVAVAKASEIAPGGMKFVRAGGKEIVVCNCDGRFYAIDRRCGHMNGPLERGALDGTFVTCPMHHVQFDVTSGQVLNHPVPVYIDEALPPKWARYMTQFAVLMEQTSVCSITTYPVQLKDDTIQVAID
jgi:nitrite reductase/ring-hydroxylating ferredoxin subunit